MSAAADIVDALTVPELRQALNAFLDAAYGFAVRGDAARLAAEVQTASALATRLATAGGDFAPVQRPLQYVRHVHIVRSLTDDQVEAIQREYIPRQRGGRYTGSTGPTLQQLADKYGVSYGAVQRAVKVAA